MQFILNKIIQNTKETLQVPSCADASARATVLEQSSNYHLSVRFRTLNSLTSLGGLFEGKTVPLRVIVILCQATCVARFPYGYGFTLD